jgi:hypothetical protein
VAAIDVVANNGDVTTGNRAFAESKNLSREPRLGLSAKNSSLRVFVFAEYSR